MKIKNICILFLVIMIATTANAAILVIEGKYQNKNIYVKNSFGGNAVGYCATEVKVNGQITTDEVNSSDFEIDLEARNLKFGDNVIIEIYHKDGCEPKVVNAEVLRPRPTFEVLSINANSSAVLKWSTKNEIGSLPYVIEQFKWNKWVPVGEVKGIGTPEIHEYSFQLVTHSGENKFRVKQVGMGATPRYSPVIAFNAETLKPMFSMTKDSKKIQFSQETAFEVYDVYGNVMKQGFGKEINIENLAKNKYYLCYDSQVTEFLKKK